ncbi:phage protease [Maledivibacter halophilus]|uniref:Mu-like prophage I protein n=1 Tax=Maledivibacter halophilus TaxID=36842 RepID=A0A1T5LWD2_9FIRM|nr:phage protease [Maledivibacter halophilus]SKC68366.1 Mu-like prophage I protein [Maledivibacter halophilus]SKC71701.1 Mu-like prophage I protein [Maledivibacter halophilus]SKC80195.1 Mu-like prophage I protein [Maledivibacter halophilus]
MKMKNRGFFIIANSIDIDGIPEKIKILPLGLVKSRKGPFKVDKESFKCMYNYFKDRKIDVVVDYEHQTLEGVQAPAAGWVKDIEYTEKGIMARVKWTDKAKGYLANKEYRYLSPVIFKRKTDDRATVLHSIALTNTPAIDGMEPIINSLDIDLEGGNKEMEFLKKLAQLLGLSEDSTEEQIFEAIKKLSEASNEKEETETIASKEVLEALDLNEGSTLDDVKGKIIALKNPAGYVSVSEFNKLKEKIEKNESDELVKMALSTGKITPAQKEWAEEIALKDPSGFKKFIDTAPQVVPLDEIGGGDDDKTKIKSSAEEISVNKMLGVSQEDIEKYGKDDK